MVPVRPSAACSSPAARALSEIRVPLVGLGGGAGPSGAAGNWLWVLIVRPSPFSHTQSPDRATVGLEGKAVGATSEGKDLAWSFRLDSSRDVGPKGTLLALNVLACAPAQVGRLSALEQAWSAPPPHGED